MADYRLGPRRYTGLQAGPVELYAWSDLRHDERVEGNPSRVWGCLLSQAGWERAQAQGWNLDCCAGPRQETLSTKILAHLDDEDVFRHYASLSEVVASLANPGEAIPALAQLCLRANWPLAENAWLVLEPLLSTRVPSTAHQLLRLHLASTPQLSSVLGPELERCFGDPESSWERWGQTWQLAWASPWDTQDSSSWVMSVSRSLLWMPAWESQLPVLDWLKCALQERLERVDPLLPLLRRRLTEFLLYDGAALKVLEEVLEDGLQPWLTSADESTLRRCLKLLEILRPCRPETLKQLLQLSPLLPLELREDALWVAYQSWLEWEPRRTVLEHPLFAARHRAQLANSTDQEADWKGYIDEKEARWLVPETLQQDLASSDPATVSRAKLWQMTFPFDRQ